jgi:translation initiation factor IF-3
LKRRPLVNNQIRAKKVRVIDPDGKNLGILSLEEALKKAQEKGLDLIQVTEKVEPPVCKIIDYGKYLYSLQKKEKKASKTKEELKGLRLSFNISPHDTEVRVKKGEKFLKKGHKIKVEMILRGRERIMTDFAKEKLNQFLESLKEKLPIKIEREMKKEGRGLTIIIAKK